MRQLFEKHKEKFSAKRVAVLGVLLTCFIAYTGSYEALSPVNFFIFMLAWLVPELLIAGWVNQY